MPAVVAASETEAAVSTTVFSAVGVLVAAEVEAVLAVTAATFRRTLSEVISDGDPTHDTDHEALAQLHNQFDLRATPNSGDALLWDGDSYSPASTESPYVGTWLDALFVRPGTVHANDDEFVGTTIDPVWTETLITGTTVWVQGLGRLSATFDSNGNDALSTILKPLSTTYPITIETAIQTYPMNGYFHAGLCMSEGIGSSAKSITVVTRHDSYDNPYLYFMEGTLGDYNSGGTQSVTPNEQPHPYGFLYLRLVWTGANTFKFLVSHDAVSWVDYFSEESATMTPTHFGMAVTANNSYTQMASFEYVRVTEADLS